MISKAHVYLVGAGPGDPELLTVKAVRLLKLADVILFDDLVAKEYLEKYPCEKIYVGKRKGKHSKTQAEINDLLLEAAHNHTTVVRLKGGDPFIFGRGGEELYFLRDKGIEVTVIPGVTASMAAAASVKIPLTHRGVSRVLSFLPGHNIDSEEIYLPGEGTMVYYMAASKIGVLSEKLMAKGLSPETPVALIQNASSPEERVEITNIRQMAKTALGSPLVIIVGDVVRGREAYPET